MEERKQNKSLQHAYKKKRRMCSYFGPLKKVGTERSILFYGSHVACAFFSLFLEVRADARREQESVEKGQNNINSSEK